MVSRILVSLALLLIPFLTSCEDKAMVAKHTKQSKRILDLRAEYAVIKEQVDKFPPRNQSVLLEENEDLVKEKKEKISNLEGELKQAKADLEEAEKAMAAYKTKFPVN